jgi:hypothetical protein
MQGVCHASVGGTQINGFGEETDIVLFRIAKKTRGIKEREVADKCSISKQNFLTAQEATCIAPRIS